MSARKKGILVALVVLLTAGAVGLNLLQRQRGDEVLRFLASLPGTLTADKVEVDILAGTVVVHKLSGDYAPFPDAPYAVRCEKLELEGVNRKAGASLGTVKLADAVRLTAFSMTGKGRRYPLLFREMSVDSGEYRGLWADWMAFSTLAGVADKAFLKALLSVRFGPALIRGSFLSFLDAPVLGPPGQTMPENRRFNTFRSALCRSEAFSLLEMGASVNEDVVLSLPHATVRFKELRVASARNPSVAYSALLRESLDIDETLGMLMRYFEEGYAARGVKGEAVELEITGVPGLVRIPAAGMDIALGDGAITVKLKADSIRVPVDTAQALVPDMNLAQAGLGEESLDFRFDLDISTSRGEDGGVTVTARQEIGEKALGDALLHVELSGRASVGAKYLPMDTATVALVSVRCELHDKKGLDALFGAPTWEDAHSGAAAREHRKDFAQGMRDGWRRNGNRDESLGRAVEAFARFIEESGVYVLKMNAERPVPLAALLWNSRSFSGKFAISGEHRAP